MQHNIKIADYDYPLPEERIARFPAAERGSSRLLVWRGGAISETRFDHLGEQLPVGSLLVFNDTRVVRARLIMQKASGARIEVFCLEPLEPADYERAFAAREHAAWVCMAGNLKRWEDEIYIEFEHEGRPFRLTARRGAPEGVGLRVDFAWDAPLAFGQLLELLGRTPIPPYLNRESEAVDTERYQTVYARVEGSVAAPTAGLHFTPTHLDELHAQGYKTTGVTLHVGAGTFLPVKCEQAADHTMHTEHFEISLATLKAIKDNPDSIVAVGTTSVRTLESLPSLAWRIAQTGSPDADRPVGQWEPYDVPEDTDPLATLIEYMTAAGLESLHAATRIMIIPGYKFRIVKGLVTNFHQPQSTLLLLVSAFTGGRWQAIYDYALQNDFRFLSYGDSSLLLP
ncbi:MAG: S-adenosylmethionine:tRNA ribosyltransferase-isomerase [Rikenellaceae bacterium]|jgi:S-adenosylmethionine:tRNA ribosyltransferase-isomerase|nr:S-adenosylmethionine:tRNA ribosyltransferase-isomerase [Rikenellaceae bacterium]